MNKYIFKNYFQSESNAFWDRTDEKDLPDPSLK